MKQTKYKPAILFTGGPKGCKTSGQEALRAAYGSKILFGKEAATQLFDEGYPRPGKNGVEWSWEWQRFIQPHICRLQLALEAEYQQRAQAGEAEAIILDRGPRDGFAYHHGGPYPFEPILTQFEYDYPACYTGVIHLDTLAKTHPHLFGTEGNEHRYESNPGRAIELDDLLWDAWKDHPCHIRVPSCESPEEKVALVIAAVGSILRPLGITPNN